MATRFNVVAGAVTALLLFVLMLPGLAEATARGRECTRLYRAGDRYPCIGGAYWQDFFAMAEWTRTGLTEDAVVLSRKPRLFHVLSGRPSAIFPLTTDTNAFFDLVELTGARFVVFDGVDAASQMYLLPAVMARPAAFCVVHVVPPSGTTLLGIVAGDSTRPTGPQPGAAPELSDCGLGFPQTVPAPAPTGT